MQDTAGVEGSPDRRVQPSGADLVSQEAAWRFSASAFGPTTGLIPPLEAMMASFRATATQLQAKAKALAVPEVDSGTVGTTATDPGSALAAILALLFGSVAPPAQPWHD